MRRASVVIVVWMLAIAVPAAAEEPTGVIEPVRTGNRIARFSGDHAVFGFYGVASPTEGKRAGLVEVFFKGAEGWSLATTLHPDGLGARVWFGRGLDIEGDTLLVGAPGNTPSAGVIGSVQVYSGSGSSWALVDSFSSPDAAEGDQFGAWIRLDGDIAAVLSATDERVYVYERAAGVWGPAATLSKPDGEIRFGSRMAVSGDTVVVGSNEAIYVYVDGPSGWELQKRIASPHPHWGNLELSGDVLVFEDDEDAVRIYHRSGETWSYAQKLRHPSDIAGPKSSFPQGIFVLGDMLLIGDTRDSLPFVVNVYGLFGDVWRRTNVFEVAGTGLSDLSLTGELLMRTGSYYEYGEYLTYGPIDATGCHGEAVTIWGTDGDDVLVGTNGPDVIHGMDGDDVIEGRGGDDLLCGGPGNDTVSFESARRVKADLTAGYARGHHGDDLLAGFENITGSKGKDVLIGDSGDNVLRGLGNRDLLRGMEGRDRIDGGDGIDATSYLWATAGVTVNLATGKAGGADGVDTLIDIEGVSGSNFDDALFGDDGPNQLRGLAGNDTLVGGLGDDVLRGGYGPKDQIDYRDAPSGVVVDLREAVAEGGDGNDRLSGVENVVGSEFGDVLIGNAKNNILSGRAGDDFLNGRSGNDTLMGGDHDNYYVPGPGNDTVRADVYKSGWDDIVSYEYSADPVVVNLGNERATGQGTDKLINVDIVIGSRFDDEIDGSTDAHGNLFVPLAGDDVVRGMKNDQVTFAFSKNPVVVNLGYGTASGEGSDRLYGVREVVGSPFDDRITGSSGDDALWGIAGDDTLRGNSGDDYLDGGDDKDRLEGGYGTDYCANGESLSSCEYSSDEAGDRARAAGTLTMVIRDFMELAARYR